MKKVKKTTIYLCAFGILIIGLLGCENSNPVITKVSKVKQLYSPKDNYSITLTPKSYTTFSWAPAKAVDGGYVSYEIAFDSAGSDFSHPVFRVPSDKNGLKTTATLSAKTLNKAAAQVGIEAQGTGKLAWTVISSRGVNQKVALESRTIQITRLAGFANPPSNLYITGEGTEGGGDLANAMPLKSTGNGQFKIYTKLTTNGTFKFVNTNSGTPREFSIVDGKIKKGNKNSTVDHNGVYQIKLDFTTGAATITEVTNLQLYLSDTQDYLFSLEYQGNGIFLAKNQKAFFYQQSWGLDSRYRFRMTLKSGGQTIYKWFASKNNDNDPPNSSTPDSYFYLYKFDSLGQWDNCFKLNGNLEDTIIDVYVYLQSGSPYTHKIKKIKDQ